MATSHIPTDLGWLTVAGRPPHEGPHALDVYTQGGQLYLKVTVNGRNPGGGNPEISLHLPLQDADQLMQGLASGLRSLSYPSVSV